MGQLSAIPYSELEAYWRDSFPDTWRGILRLARPFYATDLNFDFRPARSSAETELRQAMGRIAPGDPHNTPLGSPKQAEDMVEEFTSAVNSVAFVGPTNLRFTDGFRMIVHNHIGSIHDDIQPALRKQFFGPLKREEYDLEKRVESAFRKPIDRAWGSGALRPQTTILLSASISNVLFMGMHFASVGDARRDFEPLLTFLRAGNLPIGRGSTKSTKRTLLLLCQG